VNSKCPFTLGFLKTLSKADIISSLIFDETGQEGCVLVCCVWVDFKLQTQVLVTESSGVLLLAAFICTFLGVCQFNVHCQVVSIKHFIIFIYNYLNFRKISGSVSSFIRGFIIRVFFFMVILAKHINFC
jgi:hypothetical protein